MEEWIGNLKKERGADSFGCQNAMIGGGKIARLQRHIEWLRWRIVGVNARGRFDHEADRLGSFRCYDRFYATLPNKQATQILAGLGMPRAIPKPADSDGQQEAEFPAYLTRRPKNVVLITVESLSAEFLGSYGNAKGLTPNLDRIASQGLVFDRLFATGTRTVRGLEATSLGTPPVPGQAIVRRRKSDHLTTLGEILHHEGFATTFVYGGNAYFDNMAAYFGGNDYTVVDRGDFPVETVAFENAWGAADESLFDTAAKRLDDNTADGTPFFMHIMTSSNHRPYTYPDGRIDIASPGKRDGAVKYTDYAIGHFLEAASIGIAILVFVGLRILLRLTSGVPRPADSGPAWMSAAACASHILFYILLAATPILGLLAYYVGDPFGEIHSLAKPVFILLIVLHAAAALLHHFWLKDDTLKRIFIPGV